ncbi:MAG: GAF domain-containing protein [Cyclobacteriaceae bacterium]|nr:GAF domain-containing protein [Cyclobacteriaceae bacterium]MCH8516393.1 GAF domain-containing protein [Cyclobacteriaceae bacterium]
MKNIKLSVAKKILLGFLLLILLFAINASVSIVTLESSNKTIKETSEVVNPSLTGLNEFVLLVTRSKMYVTNWVYLRANTADKESLKRLHSIEYPELKDRLQSLSAKWDNQRQVDLLDSVFIQFEDLLRIEKEEIMNQLVSFEDYEDPMIKLLAEDEIESEVLPRSEILMAQLEELIEVKTTEAKLAQESVTSSFNQLRTIIITLGLIVIVVGLISAFSMARSITRPINYVKDIVLKLGKGELVDTKKRTNYSKDEIGEMTEAVEELLKGLREISSFAEKIGKGEYQKSFKPLSEKDVLGNSLLEMRDNLKAVSEEDRKRNWTTEGLAKFGDILRKNNDNITKLSDEIISNLVKYLNANQGGLFIIEGAEGEEPYLELKACYAWDKKKYLEQKVLEGDGLTGQAWLEKASIYMTEVPDDYIRITSGLGQANPRSILIVPLKVNDEVFGVLEIASFNKYEDFERDFVEKVAESIASTISSVKTNERTTVLLQESQELTEQMRSQEEEMRQNMEELQATQEEMERNQRERDQSDKIISSTQVYLEFNDQFKMTKINNFGVVTLGFSQEKIHDKEFKSLFKEAKVADQLAASIASDKVWSGLVDFKDASNQILKMKVSAGKIFDPINNSNKYVLFATKVDE